MKTSKRVRAAAILAALFAPPLLAQSPIQDFSLSGTVGWSDNVRGEYVDQVSDTIVGVGLQTRISQERRKFNFGLTADLQYLEYLDDTFDNEVTGLASFEGSLVLVPEILTFEVNDNFGQTQSAAFAPQTPETRQNVNVFAAGPDIRLEMGDALVLLGSGRYMNERYEVTPADNSRTLAQLGLYHEFSADSALGILGQVSDVDYDDDTSGAYDFKRTEYLARYRLAARRTAIILEGGQSRFSADDGTDRDEVLYRVSLARQLTSRTSLTLAAGRELTDSGSLFVSTVDAMEPQDGIGGSTIDDLGLGSTQLMGTGIVASVDSLIVQYARGAWRFSTPRTRAYVSADYRKERYIQGVSSDRDVNTLATGIERNLSPALRVGLDVAYYTRESLEEDDVVLRDLSIRLSTFWRVSRRVELSVAAERANRSDSSTGGGFDDNRVWARLIWSPRGTAAD